MMRGGGFVGRSKNSGYVIMGGISLFELVGSVDVFCEVSSVWETLAVREAEGAHLLLSCTVIMSACCEDDDDDDDSGTGPSNCCTSSSWRPFFSKNATLRSRDASRMDSSSRKRFARSINSVRDEEEGEAPSEVEWSLGADAAAPAVGSFCQAGIDAFPSPAESVISSVARHHVVCTFACGTGAQRADRPRLDGLEVGIRIR